MEDHHQEKVQENVAEAAEDQEIQRIFGIAYRPQDTGYHVVDQIEKCSRKIDMQVQHRIGNYFCRCFHQVKDRLSQDKTCCSHNNTGSQAEDHGCMKCFFKVFVVFRSVKLRNHYRRTGT